MVVALAVLAYHGAWVWVSWNLLSPPLPSASYPLVLGLLVIKNLVFYTPSEKVERRPLRFAAFLIGPIVALACFVLQKFI